MLTIKGRAGRLEKIALICDAVMLAVFAYDAIRYGMDMLFLILPLAAIGLYLAVACLCPEEYHFTGEALEIRRRPGKTTVIPYESVFNYEADIRDPFLNADRSDTVKLYYRAGGKKAALCRPRDAGAFLEAVKTNCPEFQEDPDGQSSLEVFFDRDR